MTDDFFPIELDFAAPAKPVPCPNCHAMLDRKTVMNEKSANVGRPYATCADCAEDGKICFWFLDFGECELCHSPIFQALAKKGKNAGRLFEACSQGCSGRFKWLEEPKASSRDRSCP